VRHGGDDRSSPFEAKHAAIIARTLRWADQAAARRDYAEALRWVETVLGLGAGLPDDYEAKRRLWRQALGECAPAVERGGTSHCRPDGAGAEVE
jgi:hypothetical protein